LVATSAVPRRRRLQGWCRHRRTLRGRTDVEAESSTAADPGVDRKPLLTNYRELLASLCYVPCCCVCAVFNLLSVAAVLSLSVGLPLVGD